MNIENDGKMAVNLIGEEEDFLQVGKRTMQYIHLYVHDVFLHLFVTKRNRYNYIECGLRISTIEMDFFQLLVRKPGELFSWTCRKQQVDYNLSPDSRTAYSMIWQLMM